MVPLENGGILIFNKGGAGCHLHDVPTGGVGRAMSFT
jgi:hypothetical protein